jgi:hypothetical protein
LSTSIPPAQARPRSGFFAPDETLNTVSFWLNEAAIVLKMNVSNCSGASYGQPGKCPEIQVATGFTQIFRRFSTAWHGLRNS